MGYFVDWSTHAGAQAAKFYKTTLWQGAHMMVGLNCLEPGQEQARHAHEGADKFYFILEGRGLFSIGDEERELAAGAIAVAPAGVAHGVTNCGHTRLTLLITLAPGPK